MSNLDYLSKLYTSIVSYGEGNRSEPVGLSNITITDSKDQKYNIQFMCIQNVLVVSYISDNNIKGFITKAIDDLFTLPLDNFIEAISYSVIRLVEHFGYKKNNNLFF